MTQFYFHAAFRYVGAVMLEPGQNAGIYPFQINLRRKSHIMAKRGAGEKERQDCWTLMTRAERVLLFFLVVTLIALFTLCIFFIVFFLTEEKTCDSRKCIEASAQLLEALDLESDPCNNYHEFICGNYIPTTRAYKDEMVLRKAGMISEPLNDEDSRLLAMVKIFYQACTNVSAIEDDAENTLSDLINRLGGWPLLMRDEWDENSFNWLRFMTKLRPLGVKSDWVVTFDYYEDENQTNLLLIGPPNLQRIPYQLKVDYYLESITHLIANLGTSSFSQRDQLMQMIDFEEKLVDICERTRSIPNDYSRRTVRELNKIWPNDSLHQILNNLSAGYAVFSRSSTIVIASEFYLYELQKLLGTTPKRTQANYLIWKTVETFLPFSSENIRETYGKYWDLENRDDHCYVETTKRFYSAIEKEYLIKYENSKIFLLLQNIADLVIKNFNNTYNLDAKVVIEGPEGKNRGVTDVNYSSDKLVAMINDVHLSVENEFYKCLYRKSDCPNEGYYLNTEKLEPRFDISENTLHLPYSLVYSESFQWDQEQYINFATIGRTIGDKIIEADQEVNNSTAAEVGVNLAYQAYLSWLGQKGMDKKLPAFNYTIHQLFWIYSSLNECSSTTDRFEEVTSSQHFREDFHCQ